MSWDRPAAMAEEEEDDEADDIRSRSGKQSVGGARVENEEGSVVADELSDLFTLASIPPARIPVQSAPHRQRYGAAGDESSEPAATTC